MGGAFVKVHRLLSLLSKVLYLRHLPTTDYTCRGDVPLSTLSKIALQLFVIFHVEQVTVSVLDSEGRADLRKHHFLGM